jgi:hypothetical protein
MNSLPFELQQLVYDFDGRYTQAMARSFVLIKQRRYTPIGLRAQASWSVTSRQIAAFDGKSFHRRFPEYYAEVEQRVRHWKNRAPSKCFKDVLGIYRSGQVYETILINGVPYKSTEKVYSVAMEHSATAIGNARGITPIVKCIEILDPAFQKKVKKRKDPIKTFRELGLSANGLTKEEYGAYYFSTLDKHEVEVDGKEYWLVVTGIHRHIWSLDGKKMLGYINGEYVRWWSDER